MKSNTEIEGFWNVAPRIKKIGFELRGKINIQLEDGRLILVPVAKFPSIKKLTPAQRKKWYLFGNGFSFDDSNEVYHLEQILGNFANYKHEN